MLLAPVIEKIEGYYAGAANAYLQFHDATAAFAPPANGTVPIREMLITPTNGFLWQYMNDALKVELGQLVNGLILCVSTTQGTLTLATGTTKATFEVSIEEYEERQYGTTTVGDFTTAVQSINPWNDGTFHSLQSIIYSSGANGQGTTYLMLFNVHPNPGMIPVQQWQVPENTPLTQIRFGNSDGSPIYSQDATTSPPTVHNGCWIYESSTPTFFTAVAGTDYTLKVVYK